MFLGNSLEAKTSDANTKIFPQKFPDFEFDRPTPGVLLS